MNEVEFGIGGTKFALVGFGYIRGRLKRRNGVAFQRRFARLLGEFAGGQIGWEKVNESVNGWVAHAAHGDTWGLRRSLLGIILPRARGRAA